jgi:hypothetical protein
MMTQFYAESLDSDSTGTTSVKFFCNDFRSRAFHHGEVRMRNLLLLFVVGGVIASGVLAISLGMAQHSSAILAPAQLILFTIAAAVYLWPSLLALHRKCRAAKWIISLNILLGWTVVGWIAAMIWAIRGAVRAVSVQSSTHSSEVVAGH